MSKTDAYTLVIR